ncbi:universal stress protein [Lentilactobacillus laojiaonis]|uniref:universal stress protein n=1 Tax=Lentilactobacillus laojiaonis TaxID=2883998 RepID=UPI001D0AE620|nr:universal stress protein [Lentilactobacillus laojiaonis]UDM32305.1 universal stress protein [Lentilactobacillus laojiaonis]
MQISHYQNILVPVDGSKQAEAALQRATNLALLNDGSIDILNVLSTSQYSYNYGGLIDGDVINSLVEDTTSYLNDLMKKVQAAGLKQVSVHIRFGNPKTIISKEFTSDHHNDLIVMGATGMGKLQQVLEGSVTSFVNRNAICDVMIVKKPVK